MLPRAQIKALSYPEFKKASVNDVIKMLKQNHQQCLAQGCKQSAALRRAIF
jgi:hypothetical protein